MTMKSDTNEEVEIPDTFFVDGVEYKADPTLEEFIQDAGFNTKSTFNAVLKAFKSNDLRSPSVLYGMTVSDIAAINGISDGKAKTIYEHAQRVKRQGKVVIDYEGLKLREGKHIYLPTGSMELDKMLSYSNGKTGWRSRTLIELYGEPSVGKTQMCYTMASLCMRSKEDGGWNRGVAYIDSEGAFEGARFEYICKYWGVDMDFMKDHLLYSRVDNMDDIELALNEIANQAREKNIGVVILDSIMDPLKSQYPVGGQELSNLQPRQKHLKRVLDKLKSLADIHNMIVIYTNHVRAEIGNIYGPTIGPQGGAVLGHASDIRIFLKSANKKDRERFGLESNDLLKMGKAEIKDCGFLPESEGVYIIGPFGIGDPNKSKELVKQAELIMEKGYLCIDSKGKTIEPPEDYEKNREEQLLEIQNALYGI